MMINPNNEILRRWREAMRTGLHAWFLSLCTAVAVLGASAAEKPNILLILVDDLGREAIGSYGGESYETPHIDHLAREGLSLDRFFVSPVCHPTRVSLLTGRYLHSVGNPAWGSFPSGELEKQTLPNALREAGYATAVAGKWQLTMLRDDPQQPHRVGFDEYNLFGWHEGPRFYKPFIWENGKRAKHYEKEYGPDVYADFLIRFMEQQKNRPFFAFYSMALCHAVSDDLDPHPPHGSNGRYLSFREMLEETDRRVGDMMAALSRLGLREKTLVFFTTDNGTSAKNYIRHEGRTLHKEPPVVSRWQGQEILGAKGKMSDWGIGVPAIVSWPGKIKSGTRSNALHEVTDLFPTFLEAALGEAPERQLDGMSFAPLLTGQTTEGRAWIASQTKSSICVRTENWKLIDDGRLYDLVADPLEQNAIHSKEDTQRSRSARGRLLSYLEPLDEKRNR